MRVGRRGLTEPSDLTAITSEHALTSRKRQITKTIALVTAVTKAFPPKTGRRLLIPNALATIVTEIVLEPLTA